ncbi:hypothetical protein FNF27_00285 [Cafeteria roenbergensis]|uniref:Mitochondrial carrier protein n=1 Tax=Cafeteria roenbergensis TaxID=33653 RepID=A0A5A8EKJ3_CAFRO|nr:hypothetical protein FNF27_00285 [Cafeteria roenbergensis]
MASQATSSSTRLADGIAGLVAGSAGVLMGHPIDTVRVRVIVGGKSPLEAASWALRTQGLRGFYRGVIPPLVTNGIVGTTVFSALEAGKRFLRPHVEAGALDERAALAMAGAFAGAVVSLVSTPPQVLKLLCESVGRMTYYLTYETAKGALVRLRTGSEPLRARPLDPVAGVSLPERMLAGACAGCVGWTVTFPFDVARNRLVSQGDALPPRYRGVLHCLLTSVREEGPQVLFRGLGVTLLRAGPVAMTVLPTFDLVREFLAAHLEQP